MRNCNIDVMLLILGVDWADYKTVTTNPMLRPIHSKYFFYYVVLTPVTIQEPGKKVYGKRTMLPRANFFRILNYTDSLEFEENNTSKITTTRTDIIRA